jgi:hypothetical protein
MISGKSLQPALNAIEHERQAQRHSRIGNRVAMGCGINLLRDVPPGGTFPMAVWQVTQ